MKRKMIILLVCALIAGPFLMESATAKTLKIGTISPLTGPYAADGNDIAKGAKTAVEVIMAEGGIPGYDKIKVVSQDTACDPRQAGAGANKLINQEGVGGSSRQQADQHRHCRGDWRLLFIFHYPGFRGLGRRRYPYADTGFHQ